MDPRRTELSDRGFTILPGYMSADMLQSMRARVDELFAEEGDQAGSEFRREKNARRLANLVDKGEVFREAISSAPILALVESVLGPEFKLSSLNVRSAPPHSNSLQPLHIDMGLLPDQRGYAVCNTVWMLDDFTEENGTLRVVPGSHHLGRRPQDVLDDLNAVHPEEILVTGGAGTVVVMNSHLWHGGTANRTAAERRALHGFYCRRDIPQQQYQKKLLRHETQAALDFTLRRILALDDPMNDRLSETSSGQSGFLK